jgi:LysR family carnitine catabolism transcriptional activator
MEQAVYHLQSRFKLEEGRLTIAAIPAFACNQLPPILLALQDKHPGLQVQVNDVVTEDVVSSVVNNRVELGITFDPGPLQGVDFHPLFEDRFVMVVSPHIAADFPRNAPLSWQDLADVPYIALQSPSSVRTLIQAALEENGMAYPQLGL